jgi:hypothetical protein
MQNQQQGPDDMRFFEQWAGQKSPPLSPRTKEKYRTTFREYVENHVTPNPADVDWFEEARTFVATEIAMWSSQSHRGRELPTTNHGNNRRSGDDRRRNAPQYRRGNGPSDVRWVDDRSGERRRNDYRAHPYRRDSSPPRRFSDNHNRRGDDGYRAHFQRPITPPRPMPPPSMPPPMFDNHGDFHAQQQQQYPQNPSQQYPQNPSQQYPQNPSQQYPQNPSQQYPQNPPQQRSQNPQLPEITLPWGLTMPLLSEETLFILSAITDAQCAAIRDFQARQQQGNDFVVVPCHPQQQDGNQQKQENQQQTFPSNCQDQDFIPEPPDYPPTSPNASYQPAVENGPSDASGGGSHNQESHNQGPPKPSLAAMDSLKTLLAGGHT